MFELGTYENGAYNLTFNKTDKKLRRKFLCKSVLDKRWTHEHKDQNRSLIRLIEAKKKL